MLKKYILFITSLLFFFSCSLPNRLPSELGSEASLKVSFTLPGGSVRTSASSRLLLAETGTVEIILYRPFEEDTLTADSVPTAAEVDNLVNSELVISETLSFSSGSQVSHRIDAIPLGEWNVLIGSFLTGTPQWQDADFTGPVSFAVYKGLTLEAGTNQLALTLALNSAIGNVLNVSNGSNGLQVLSDSNLVETMVIQLENFLSREYTLHYNLDPLLEGLVEVNFYQADGALLPLTFTDGPALLDMSAPGSSLDMTVSGSAGLNLTEFQRLQVSISPDGTALYINIGVYDIPPTLTLSLEGFILPDTALFEAYLYQSFTGDPLAAGLPPTQVNLDTIAQNSPAGIFYSSVAYDGSTPELRFNSNLTAGTWNLVVAALDADAAPNGWTIQNGLVSSTQSYAWGEALELVSGENTRTLTMSPNAGNPIMNRATVGVTTAANWNGAPEYSAMLIEGFTPGTGFTFTMNAGTTGLENIWYRVEFYDMSGNLLDVPSSLSGTTTTWTFMPTVETQSIVMLITPNSINCSSMDMTFTSVTDRFTIAVTTYTSLLLQLDGVLLPDTEVVDVILYQLDTFSLVLEDSNPGMISGPINTLLGYNSTFHQIFPVASLDANNQILIENIPSGDYKILVSAIGDEFYDLGTETITWEYIGYYQSNLFTPGSFFHNTTATALTASSTTLAVPLAPNVTRYQELIADANGQLPIYSGWDSMFNKDYILLFVNSFPEESTYNILYETFHSLNFLFSQVAFYDGKGTLLDMNDTPSLTSRGDIQHSWTYTDTLDNDLLMMLFQVDRTKAETYLNTMSTGPHINFSFDPSSGHIVESLTSNPVSLTFTNLEKSMMTGGDYLLDVLIYDGSPLPGTVTPSQSTIDTLLRERTVTRGTIPMIFGQTDLQALLDNRAFPGTWNFLFGTFPSSPGSWDADYDRGGVMTTLPAYMSYNYTNMVSLVSATPRTLSMSNVFRLNVERYRYLAGRDWGSGINGYYDVQNGEPYTYSDSSGEPLVFVFTNLQLTDNRLYMNLNTLPDMFQLRLFKSNGASMYSYSEGTGLTPVLDGSNAEYTHYLSLPYESADASYILTLTPISVNVSTMNITPFPNGFGVTATVDQPLF